LRCIRRVERFCPVPSLLLLDAVRGNAFVETPRYGTKSLPLSLMEISEMNSKWLKWIVPLVAAAVAAWLFYQKVYLPRSTYDYVTVKKGELPLQVFGIGTVDAKNRYAICSNSGGKVVEILKEEGDRIEKGELVGRLDGVDLPQQLAQAEARLKSVQLETEALKKDLEGLRAKRRLAEITFARYERLHRQGYSAKAEYDKAKTDLEALDAQIEASLTRIEAKRAQEREARKAIEAIGQRIRRLSIVSPVGGYVVSKEARVGQTLLPQQPLLEVVRPEDVWVKINIDERISGAVHIGQRATITLRSRATTPLKGRVVRIETRSDPVTEERIVDVAFDTLPEPFHLNEQAEARIETGKLENVVLVPAHVVRQGEVWIYDHGKARRKTVEIIDRNDTFLAVEGIEPGAKILVPDPHKKPLFDGASVRL